MDSIHRLEEIFAKFPGIGPRQARRFVYYLLNKSAGQINEFLKLVESVKKMTNECSLCHRIYVHERAHSRIHDYEQEQIDEGTPPLQGRESLSKNTTAPAPRGPSLCSVCSNSSRDQSTLMVVARDSDFETIEKSGVYNGLYFILGGTIPILDKEPDKRIRLEALLKRISTSSTRSDLVNLKEIILSLNTTPDGENTTHIVKEAIREIMNRNSASIVDTTGVGTVSPNPFKITILGRGLSTGAELEYADGETIKNALKNRN